MASRRDIHTLLLLLLLLKDESLASLMNKQGKVLHCEGIRKGFVGGPFTERKDNQNKGLHPQSPWKSLNRMRSRSDFLPHFQE